MGKSYTVQMEEHRAARRRAFLAAAAKTLAEKGIRQTIMDDVAAAAGVSKMVLYRYFESKESMVHAVLEHVVDKLLAADAEDAEWWTERVRHTLEVVRANRDPFLLLARHASHDPVFGVHYKRLFDALVARVLERQIEILGADRATPVNGLFLAETTTALFLDTYARWTENGLAENDQAFLDWLTRSVRALSYYWGGEAPPEN